MAAIWDKHVKTVTFTVTFTECSERGALRFESAVEGSLPGYLLRWSKKNGNPYFTFKAPPKETTNDDESFELTAEEMEAIRKRRAAKARAAKKTS